MRMRMRNENDKHNDALGIARGSIVNNARKEVSYALVQADMIAHARFCTICGTVLVAST